MKKITLYLNDGLHHFCYIKEENRTIHYQNLIKEKAKEEFGMEIKSRKDIDRLYNKIVKKYYSKSLQNKIFLSERDTCNVKRNWLIGGNNDGQMS